ncbi:hypothetical protein AAF712_012117 [Marasmius tenuissimus]|uniref:Uncharacterized protein n=1 Tax=Marasmius tenuissimus TaxID=585030 RepID=A0ABR2ZIK5_9AGAR
MPVGRESSLPADQLTWLNAKTALLRELLRNGVPTTALDANIKEWKAEWEEKFDIPVEDLVKNRESIHNWFKNTKRTWRARNAQPKMDPDMGHTPLLFDLAPQLPPTPYQLFIESQGQSINEVVNNSRATDELGGDQHVGLLQKAWSKEYQATKAFWKECTERVRVEMESDIPAEAKNQETFVDQIQEALDALLRRGRGKIGNGSLLLYYGYRDADNALKTGLIHSRGDPHAQSLSLLFPDQVKRFGQEV